ncbi:hypothetical protein V144x_26600 [Gimesia aquarii]|uniref:Uncharacterized protein n=1 Tax=Gimesia aquarii TaxID=2527964 RepID=A0A517VW09_9PLAN|nr:hypothetical protein V144x_26600 [Gimesia aquarii]
MTHKASVVVNESIDETTGVTKLRERLRQNTSLLTTFGGRLVNGGLLK